MSTVPFLYCRNSVTLPVKKYPIYNFLIAYPLKKPYIHPHLQPNQKIGTKVAFGLLNDRAPC
jgi:hypothetical protein